MSEDDNFLSLAWRIINDSLRTDVCLLYPPYQIALAAVYMACVVKNKDPCEFFKELCVDMDKILEITQEILKLYEILKNYDEKKDMLGILGKAPKPKTSSRPSSSASSNSQYLSQSPVVSSQTGTPR
jgi:cyclin C